MITDDESAPLAWFLEQDVQRDENTCVELLAACDQIAAHGGTWELSGNAHSIVITQENVAITNEYAPPPNFCEIPISDFKKSVEIWLQYIANLENPNH